MKRNMKTATFMISLQVTHLKPLAFCFLRIILKFQKLFLSKKKGRKVGREG
jgi:hypothetical protein